MTTPTQDCAQGHGNTICVLCHAEVRATIERCAQVADYYTKGEVIGGVANDTDTAKSIAAEIRALKEKS